MSLPKEYHNSLFPIKQDEEVHSTEVFRASVALIISRENWSLMIMKRAKNEKDPWSGHYGFPGGMVEKGETAFEAVLREAKEEVGVDLSMENAIGRLAPYKISYLKDALIHPFVFYFEREPKVALDLTEVEKAYFWPLRGLLSPSSLFRQDFETQVGVISRPALRFEDHIFWGISLGILNNLLVQWEGLSAPWDQAEGKISPFNLL